MFGIRLSPGIFFIRDGFIEQRQKGLWQMLLALESVNFPFLCSELRGLNLQPAEILLFWALGCELIRSSASGLLI